MNFDSLILNDSTTGLYPFNPSLLILLFWSWQYSPYCVIQCLKQFKLHSVETVSEVTRKTWSKGKQIKNHSRTSHKIQSEELNEKFRSTLPEKQINWTTPAKRNLKKIDQQTIKLNKSIIIAKTLKLLHLRQNWIPLNIPIQKYVLNQFLLLKLLQYYICKAWKNSLALEDWLTRKWPKIFSLNNEINYKFW